MSLSGQTIGNYRIETLLGSGGMGQVYRATHIHLGREAAIKVLHEQYAADPSFQARFQQEARAAAGLNHPNIVEIYDFGQQDGRYFLIMELLTDGSLRSLLQQAGANQPLQLPLAVSLIRQAAEGLAYAHSRNMVHRDVKPDNLLLRAAAGGALTVKITDFGLARLSEGGVATATGVTMGTPAYMSPEQCQGIELDGRSDTYSLGVVLYEVVTGYVPFETKSLSDAVYKHVYTPPPSPRSQRPDLPPALESIILSCLAKTPAERFENAGALATALANLNLGAAVAPTPPTPTVNPQATAVGTVEGLRVLLERDTLALTPGQQAVFPVTVVNLGREPLNVILSVEGVPDSWGAAQGALALPPGGQASASLRVTVPRAADSKAGDYAVTIRARARENPALTAEAAARWNVAPFGGVGLALAPLTASGRRGARYTLTVTNQGNARADLTPTPVDTTGALRFKLNPPTLAPEPGGTASGQLRVSPAKWRWLGSQPTTHSFQVGGGAGAPPVEGSFSQRPFMPVWLAPVLAILLFLGIGGGALALTRGGNDDDGNPAGVAVATSTTAPPVATATAVVAVVPSVRGAETPAEATENPTPTEEATDDGATAIADADASATADAEASAAAATEAVEPVAGQDAIAFATGLGEDDPNGILDIYIMDADGTDQTPLITAPGDDWTPEWSHDGARIAFASKRNGNDDIYIANADGSDERQLTDDPAEDLFPTWSFDDAQIAFNRDGQLWVVDLATDATTQLTQDGSSYGYIDWSPDGSRLLLLRDGHTIVTMRTDGSELTDITGDDVQANQPAWSPDGTHIVFTRNEDGVNHIYSVAFDGSELTQLTSSEGDDSYPAWSPDGGQIAFMRQANGATDLYLMAADGSDQRRLATDPDPEDPGLVWSPDAAQLAFLRNGDAGVDIYVVTLDSQDIQRLTDNPKNDKGVTWRR